jgi:hypothetical protein
MEPVINDIGCQIMRDRLKSKALFYDYYRRMGVKIYSPWDGKEIDVDALLAKAFPESKKYNK